MIIQVIIPVSIVSALGLLFGIGLSYALRNLEVKPMKEYHLCVKCCLERTVLDVVLQDVTVLQKLSVKGEAKITGCPVGGASVSSKIQEILGVGKRDTRRKVAQVMCNGTLENCKRKYNYDGIEDCVSANAIYGRAFCLHIRLYRSWNLCKEHVLLML